MVELDLCTLDEDEGLEDVLACDDCCTVEEAGLEVVYTVEKRLEDVGWLLVTTRDEVATFSEVGRLEDVLVCCIVDEEKVEDVRADDRAIEDDAGADWLLDDEELVLELAMDDTELTEVAGELIPGVPPLRKELQS